MTAKLVGTSRQRRELEEQLRPWYPRQSLFTRFMLTILDNRDAVLEQDRRNSALLSTNVFGLVLDENDNPYMCGCGGSGYLCSLHAIAILEKK